MAGSQPSPTPGTSSRSASGPADPAADPFHAEPQGSGPKPADPQSVAGNAPEVCDSVEICNQRGLHARAAAKFVKLAAQFDAEIEVRRNDMVVSGQSIMGLMMLAAGPGTTITLCAYGAQAEAAVAALVDLVARKFDES